LVSDFVEHVVEEGGDEVGGALVGLSAEFADGVRLVQHAHDPLLLGEWRDDQCARQWLGEWFFQVLAPGTAIVFDYLDQGYDCGVTRTSLASLAITGEIARKGVSAPLQAGIRRVIEQTQSWMNDFGKVRRRTERNSRVIDFYLFLAATFVVTRCLIQHARNRYRCQQRGDSGDANCRSFLTPDQAAVYDQALQTITSC
jgi:hypothetical protein